MTAKAAATTTGPIVLFFLFFTAVLGIPVEVGLRTYMDHEIMVPTSLKGRPSKDFYILKTRKNFRKFGKPRKELVKLLQKIRELMESGRVQNLACLFLFLE